MRGTRRMTVLPLVLLDRDSVPFDANKFIAVLSSGVQISVKHVQVEKSRA